MPDRDPACPAWRETLAGWLVAQVGPDEEAALVAHLTACSTCAAEADSLLTVAAVSLGADPGGEPWWPRRDAPPPADLPDRIVARVAAERTPRRGRRAAAGLALAVAASVVLATVLWPDGSAPLDGETVAFARLAPGVEADATVAPDAAGSLVELTASGLDPAVTYALWLTPPGGGYRQRVPAGTFRPDDDGTVEVTLRSALPAEDRARVWATTADGQIVLDTES